MREWIFGQKKETTDTLPGVWNQDNDRLGGAKRDGRLHLLVSPSFTFFFLLSHMYISCIVGKRARSSTILSPL